MTEGVKVRRYLEFKIYDAIEGFINVAIAWTTCREAFDGAALTPVF